MLFCLVPALLDLCVCRECVGLCGTQTKLLEQPATFPQISPQARIMLQLQHQAPAQWHYLGLGSMGWKIHTHTHQEAEILKSSKLVPVPSTV